MNQPESLIPSVAAPLQQHKVQLISKGYSCQEVKEANSVICIFRFCHTDLQDELMSIPPISNN
jgi:hypothetical protein